MFCKNFRKIEIKKGLFLANKQKGSSLLFTILIMSFVMGISFGVSYILFQEIKIMRDIGNSVVAFYAAESGIEKLMMNQANLQQGDIDSGCFDNPHSNICYETTVYAPGDNGCPEIDNLDFCLQSVGNYGGTKRAIQLKY